MCFDGASNRSYVLELSHLIHSRHGFLLRDVVNSLRDVVWLVNDFDCGYVRAVTVVIRKVDIIGEQEVHKALLFVLG